MEKKKQEELRIAQARDKERIMREQLEMKRVRDEAERRAAETETLNSTYNKPADATFNKTVDQSHVSIFQIIIFLSLASKGCACLCLFHVMSFDNLPTSAMTLIQLFKCLQPVFYSREFRTSVKPLRADFSINNAIYPANLGAKLKLLFSRFKKCLWV